MKTKLAVIGGFAVRMLSACKGDTWLLPDVSSEHIAKANELCATNSGVSIIRTGGINQTEVLLQDFDGTGFTKPLEFQLSVKCNNGAEFNTNWKAK